MKYKNKNKFRSGKVPLHDTISSEGIKTVYLLLSTDRNRNTALF